MERLTKLAVIGWTCAALGLEIYFLRGGWLSLPVMAGAAFALAFAAAIVDRRAIAAVLLFTYIYPTLVYAAIGRFYAPYAVVWIAPLFGAMLPSALTSRWHLSARWRAPLVCWALTVVVGATIVVAREFDFNLDLIEVTSVANSSIGGWPSYVAGWTLHVAVINVIGILWFDWLSQLGPSQFRSTVIAPLGVSGAAMIIVAICQLLFDVHFLNPTVYAGIQRATGTVLDSNVCGTVAALWIGGLFLLMPDRRSWQQTAAAVGVAAGWLAVWAAGSRTGFATAIIVTLFSGSAWLRRDGQRRLALTDRRVLLGVAATVAVLALLALAPLRVIGPLQRVRNTAPGLSPSSMTAFAAEMWNRNGYGSLATTMIGWHPWVGVGVGAYHVMLGDFSRLTAQAMLPPDNAQNWLRHQVVEFGLLGSLGCLAWLAAFVPFVLKRQPGEPSRAVAARGMLVAFAAVSMLGVPSQDVIAAITFWTAAFWYVSTTTASPPTLPLRRLAWVAVLLAVALYAVPLAAVAATTLRVPTRAQRVGWPYSYGFYPAELDDDGGERRWTGRHAVAVVEAPTRHLSLTLTVDPLGVNFLGRGPGQVPPVQVRVWVDRALVVDARVMDTRPIERSVTLPADERRALIEAEVSRTFRPRQFGNADDRELGVLTRWRFLSEAPAASPSGGQAQPGP